MSQDDMFQDFPETETQHKPTVAELVILMRLQYKELTAVKEALTAHDKTQRELKDEIHRLILSHTEKSGELAQEVDRLNTKLSMFKTMLGIFGAIGVLVVSSAGYVLRTTWEKMEKDHDRLIALSKQVDLQAESSRDGKIPVNQENDRVSRN